MKKEEEQRLDEQVGEEQVGEAQVGEEQVGEAQVGEAQVGEEQVSEAQATTNLCDRPNRRPAEPTSDLPQNLYPQMSNNNNDAENPKVSDIQKSPEAPTPSGEIQTNWYSSLLQQVSVYGIAAGYCISASLLSIINKWAVMKFPYPGALTALQYCTSAAGVFICGWLKLIEYDRLDLLTMWRFLPAAIIFYLSLFTNSELLLHANVDTFIVFRSAVPICVAVGETLFLHQPWPSIRTWMSLATIFGGSVLYVLTDYQFTFMAYSWALAYLVVLPVGLSCLFGLSISFFGFSCRRAISATGFTVLGIVNKLLTVVINLVIWDKHSTFVGTLGLLICMLGGVLYQQSTSKKPKDVKEVKTQETDEEQQKLLEMQCNNESNGNQKEAAESEVGK
ncbi:hypothetical protein CMV_007481 [Castanea mollissima]|uniref:Sugar phosphate transporter domain-containing protein n=1 Tax=Castanea mollissima TaxID=60419 RepID=A0A8J4RTK5_9ROSI|nr:hypothetical protein CMV_007481 [Castanea mollissima]